MECKLAIRGYPTIHQDMDGPSVRYGKQKSQRQVMHDIVHMWGLKK